MIHDNSSQHESTSADNSIRVGACGWNQAHWQGSFYPDDLPEDWRLSYYANEFSTVLVPASIWQAEDIESWCEEVQDDFHFYFQNSLAEGEDLENEISRLRQILGSHFAGFVDLAEGEIDKKSGVAVITMKSRDLRGWREWLQQHGDSLRAIFLNDQSLSYKNFSDFKSLLELLNL